MMDIIAEAMFFGPDSVLQSPITCEEGVRDIPPVSVDDTKAASLQARSQ